MTGLGPVNYIAQNGIQLGFGALGDVQENKVSANVYAGTSAASSGILLFTAGNGILVNDNTVGTSDVGIWVNSTSNARVKNSKVTGSTYDGIALDDNQSRVIR